MWVFGEQCVVFSPQVLRVGVTHIKYVSLPNSRAWVIHNFKDTRGRGQPNKVVADTVSVDC